jgi:type I restriction enzyme S subunit
MSEYNNELIEFPKDWEVKRLKELAKIIMGQSPPSSAYNDKGQGLPFIQGSKDFGDIYPSIKTFTTICKKIAPKDSILFSVRAPVGDINISDREICIGRGIAAIVPYNKTDLLYLYYYLIYSAFKIKRYSSGTTFESIKERDLENFQIILPPLDERKKIVKILNTIDSIIIDTTNLIEKLKILKEKTLNLLITGKTWHKEFKDTEIGKIPKNWEIKKLKDVIIKAKSGGTPRRNVPEYWNGNIPFAKAQDITKAGKYLYNTEELITEKGLENSNAWIVPKDSLLLTIYGSLGFVAINKIPVATNQQIVSIIPNKNIVDIEFLYYWYLYFKPYWSRFIKKDAVPHLTLEIVLNNLISIPPLEEQKKIADILSTIDNKIETETKYLDYMKKLKEKLLAALMTGKIRVNSISIGDTK